MRLLCRSARDARRAFHVPPLAQACAIAALAASVALPLAAQVQEKVDLNAVYEIKDEGFQRSEVMTIASYLTDVHGPRLTGSPTYNAAASWARDQLKTWGLTNATLEPFPFGRGWANERMSAHVVAPTAYPLIAYPKAWTPGTAGPVTAEAAIAVVESEADFAKFKGQLKGKIVLTRPMRELKPSFAPLATRYDEKTLAELSLQDDPSRPARRPDYRAMMALMTKAAEFFRTEGVVATFEPSRTGDGGTVFVQSGGGRDAKDPAVPTQVVLAAEQYNRIYRTLEKKVPVRIELDIRNQFYDKDLNSYNVVADLPGTDPQKSSEIVMVGGHLDSWHTGTGATDNAAGCAVMMEAVRILKATGLPLKRTVRIGLWGGEEQGLLGSRAYVKDHLGDRETMALKPEHAKLAAYFNVDNGTGAIRGVYLQRNEAVAPIFQAWMEPFRGLGMTALTIRNTSGTDHLSFDAVGLPAFQFVQDEVEYDTRTHHSNMDTWDRLQASDMMRNAVIVASFVYDAANRDEMLPRKPLPKPTPSQGTRPVPTAGM